MQQQSQTVSDFESFTVSVTETHLNSLHEAGIFLSQAGHPLSNWLSKAKKIVFYQTVYAESNVAFLGAGFFNIGAHSYSKSALHHLVRVGRYCSIGGSISIMPASHPMSRLSTCGFDYANFQFHPQGFAKISPQIKSQSLVIQNDVWIGDSALLARGIKIGHGAVIGARSIVTKDVPPYAVVAGSPATVRRYRFDEATIDRLLKSEWWNVDPADLTVLDTTDVPAFLDGFEALRANGRLRLYQPRITALHDIFRPAESGLAPSSTSASALDTA